MRHVRIKPPRYVWLADKPITSGRAWRLVKRHGRLRARLSGRSNVLDAVIARRNAGRTLRESIADLARELRKLLRETS